MTAGERAQRLYDEITYGAGVSAATAAIEAAEAAVWERAAQMAETEWSELRTGSGLSEDLSQQMRAGALVAKRLAERYRALAAQDKEDVK